MTSLARIDRAKQLQNSFVLRLTSSPCAIAVFQSSPATSDCLPTPTLYARRASSRACRLGSEGEGASSTDSSLLRFIGDARAHAALAETHLERVQIRTLSAGRLQERQSYLLSLISYRKAT